MAHQRVEWVVAVPPHTRDCLDCAAPNGMRLQNVVVTEPANIPLLYICEQCRTSLTIPPREAPLIRHVDQYGTPKLASEPSDASQPKERKRRAKPRNDRANPRKSKTNAG